MRIIESFGSWNSIRLEESTSTDYPVNNATNQKATGKEKSMIDELNKLLQLASDSKTTYSQKAILEPKILDFFSKAGCDILDKAIMKSAGVGDPTKAEKAYPNAEDWISEVVMLGGSTNDDGEIWNIKYEIGVMYFSLDDQGKITNIVVG